MRSSIKADSEAVEASTSRVGETVADIPRFVPLRKLGAKERKLMKNNKYPINIPVIPKGMKCTFKIAPCLVKIKYEDHDFLESTDYTVEPFKERMGLESDPIVCTPQQWALGLEKSWLLGLIHMPHFGRLTKANTCAKQLLACIHGGYLWLDQPVPVTVYLISQITVFPKKGLDLSQYFHEKYNDKRLATKLKKKYDLEHDGRAYVVDSINEQAVHIATRILSRKVLCKN